MRLVLAFRGQGMGTAELFDIRSDMWKSAFGRGLPYQAFVATGAPSHQQRWQDYEGRISLSDSQKKLLAGFSRQINVVVLAGMWCGDCARQCPMLAKLADASSAIQLRFIDNQADVQVRDELRVHGAARVPATVLLSEDMFEVARGPDRTLAAYRRKAVTELGAACDLGIVAPPASDMSAELQEWIDLFERAHILLRVSPFLRNRHHD